MHKVKKVCFLKSLSKLESEILKKRKCKKKYLSLNRCFLFKII